MTIICGECGSKNENDADFCSTCGEPLEWTGVRTGEEAAAATAVAAAPPVAPPVEAPAPPAPAPAPEAPPPPAPEPPPPAAATAATPPPPPAPGKGSLFGRKPKAPPPPPSMAAAAAAPPPPPAAAPPVAPPPPAPPAPAASPPPTRPDIPAAPPPRVPPPRRPTAARPPEPEADDEAARIAEEDRRREEAARRLVVPVERPVAPAPVVVAEAPPPPPEKLSWWQRFVRWFKRVILRRKPAVAAAAVAAPVAAEVAAPPPAEASVAARAPAAQKPGGEYERRVSRPVEEEASVINPGDLICVQCGTGNPPTNKFCKRCGTSLAEAAVQKKPSWIKRFFGFFAFRKKRRYRAGERRKKQQQQGGGGGKVFWRLQGISFKAVGVVMLVIAGLVAYKAFGGTLTDRWKGYYNSIHAKYLPSYPPVGAFRATASSEKDRKHGAGKAIDGANNTAWISKATKQNGEGESITIHFAKPTRVGAIVLLNGDETNAKSFAAQGRVTTARLTYFDLHGQPIGKPKKCNFGDKQGKQTCKFDVKHVRIMKVRAIAVAPGQKGDSVAITEIEPKGLK